MRRTLELCLEKDARKRIADMRDVKLALAGTFATARTVASNALARAADGGSSGFAGRVDRGAAAVWLAEGPRTTTAAKVS